MNKITIGMRSMLSKRSGWLHCLLDRGIRDDDWYRNACECFALLNSIIEEDITPVEILQLHRLLELIDAYEIKPE